MSTSEKDRKRVLRKFNIGGKVNTAEHVGFAGYNPAGEIEYTAAPPYKLIVHERFHGVHLRQVFYLDDYKGKVISWDQQELVDITE